MVEGSYRRRSSAEESERYKFECCKSCPLFYECEMIQEYVQFRTNHPKPIKGGPVSITPDGIPVFQGTAISTPTDDSEQDIFHTTRVAKRSCFETDSPSYDKEELNTKCFMTFGYVQPIECGRQQVAEGIGDHFKIETEYNGKIKADTTNRWEAKQAVFISAQTGQGKNYFIEHYLIPYVRSLNHDNNTRQKNSRPCLKNKGCTNEKDYVNCRYGNKTI